MANPPPPPGAFWRLTDAHIAHLGLARAGPNQMASAYITHVDAVARVAHINIMHAPSTASPGNTADEEGGGAPRVLSV